MTLLERFHPVTCDFGLINLPVENTVRGLLEWHRDADIRYRREDITTSFEDALNRLPPLSMAKQRRLFVPTTSDWTACFQNGINGSDPFPAMSQMARTVGVVAMRVCSTPAGAVWPANIWEVYAPPGLGGEEPVGYRRSICASNDGGRWVFEQSGEPFDFEDTAAYKARLKRNRFTRELLVRYLGEFGIRPFDEDFYVVNETAPAVLLQQTAPVVSMPEFTLDEVLTGVPWKRESDA